MVRLVLLHREGVHKGGQHTGYTSTEFILVTIKQSHELVLFAVPSHEFTFEIGFQEASKSECRKV